MSIVAGEGSRQWRRFAHTVERLWRSGQSSADRAKPGRALMTGGKVRSSYSMATPEGFGEKFASLCIAHYNEDLCTLDSLPDVDSWSWIWT